MTAADQTAPIGQASTRSGATGTTIHHNTAPSESGAMGSDGLSPRARTGGSPAAAPDGTGPTTAQVRSAISQSHEVQDIHGSEIAAAPLGTDAEAGSAGPASAEVRARAEAAIERANAGGSTPRGGAQ